VQSVVLDGKSGIDIVNKDSNASFAFENMIFKLYVKEEE